MPDTSEKSGFAARLEAVMKERNFSAAALSERTKLNQQYIYRVLRGDAKPGFYVACALADALSCTLGELRDPPEKAVCNYCRQQLEPMTPHIRTDDSMKPSDRLAGADRGGAPPAPAKSASSIPDLWPADLATREYPEDRFDQADTDPVDDQAGDDQAGGDVAEVKADTPKPPPTTPENTKPEQPEKRKRK